MHPTNRAAPETSAAPLEGGPLFPIVGVGASAGGLEAFSELLKHLPLDTGMGFVLVQHLDPEHASALTQLLSRATALPVSEVTNDMSVEADHVYIIPPNKNLTILNGVLKLKPRRQRPASNRSIDSFFESLATDQHERSIGVILSGTATDGTLGLEAIKAEGGITFAQDDSARYDSMPRSAVFAGCVDFVLSPEKIARELARIAKHPSILGQSLRPVSPKRRDPEDHAAAHQEKGVLSSWEGSPGKRKETQKRIAARGSGEQSDPTRAASGLDAILLLLRNHSGVDFSFYKSATIQRRIIRRMVLSKHDTLEDYAEFLRGNREELESLYSDALISVTSFFRNPEAFDLLKQKVVPKLLQQHGDKPFRVWVLGCSTGQEAYSIAMAFIESADKAPRMRGLQVFATDLNERSLVQARHGLYAKSLLQNVSPERLRRFFVEEEGGYRVVKSLREIVVFARQNLIDDPPFSRMDLISCRNLLIYLEPSWQKKALPTFHFALKPGGFLMLGASESIGGFTDLFEPLDKKLRIYTKKIASAVPLHLPVKKDRSGQMGQSPRHALPTAQAESLEGMRTERSAQREADRVMVRKFAPPSVLINADLQILQFRGPTSPYLEPPTGKATFDVLKMARPCLMLPLRAAIHKARKENKIVRKENVHLQQDGCSRTVHLEVIPLKNLPECCYLILFEEADPKGVASTEKLSRVTARKAPTRKQAETNHTAELQAEILEIREYMQLVQQQNEVTNEELQALNEEVQSANEELQSINEELETSKEELESSNEELITVNEEMSHRNIELNRLNSDLVNLQTSTKITIVLLGRDLTIRRFSSQAEKQFDLQATDFGRPIGNIRHNLDTSDLEAFIRNVIDTVHEQNREVQDKEGRWYSLHVRPYMTLDNKVDGAVLVLVEIDAIKRAGEAAARLAAIVASSGDAIISKNLDGVITSWNVAAERLFGYTADEMIGKPVALLIPLDRIDEELGILERIRRGEKVDYYETVRQRKDGSLIDISLTVSPIREEGGRIIGAAKIARDITDRKRVVTALRESEAQFAAIFNQTTGGIAQSDLSGRLILVNERFCQIVGRSREELLTLRMHDITHPDDLSDNAEKFRLLAEGNGPNYVIEKRYVRPDGSAVWVHNDVAAIHDSYGNVHHIVAAVTDITELKRAEQELHEANERKNEFLAMLAHELRNPLAPIRNMLEIMKRAKGDAGLIEEARNTMDRQLLLMTRLIDDLLDVSRIASGKLELRRENVELTAVVRTAVEASRPAMESANHHFTVTLPPHPVYLHADPVRLAQVFGNLLNNACKYTDPEGHVWLTAEQHGAEVVVSIKDTGLGIAPDMLSTVFEMFAQVDQSLQRSEGGLGIGLTLVHRLAEMHGGSVQAFSEGLGRGSEFVVRLPVMSDTSKTPPQEPATSEPVLPMGRRILVVDDNRDSAKSLAMLLNLAGVETRTAFDGLEAVEAAANFRPEVVLLDIGLPRLNGYDAARRIREKPWGKDIMLVALTGWGQEEDRQRSKNAGFNAHLVKPVDHAALTLLLAELLPNGRA